MQPKTLLVRDDWSVKTAINLLNTGFDPVGLDTETVGCNPRKESPIENAEVFCLTLAVEHRKRLWRIFVPRKYLYYFQAWLESEDHAKVGSRIFTYDRHVLANEGITLRGIVGDTERMSKLLDPSKFPAHSENPKPHGLKQLGAQIGYETTPYKDIASRPRHGPEKAYKRDRIVTGEDGRLIHYTAGAPYQPIRWTSYETIPLTELWELYPQRRQVLVDYAVQDAEMSLAVYKWLKSELEARKW